MIKMIIAVRLLVFALLVGTAHALDLTLPDPILTPGAVRDFSIEEICHTKWGLDRRAVTQSMKREVMASYQFSPKLCLSGKIEIDHLVPRELGGRDSTDNLWPMCYEVGKKDPTFGARHKDRLENFLRVATCAGNISLRDAQEEIRSNWVESYRKRFNEPKR